MTTPNFVQPNSFPTPMYHQPGMPIASAPGPNEFPTPMYVPQPPPGGWPATNMICPPGLEYLMGLDHLFVKQKIELFEVIVDFETKNKYKVMNIRGEQIYYVAEKSSCCSRYCCGTYRSCEFQVMDGVGREVLNMIRPLKCDSCCCPCCLQELEVYSGGVLMGSVVQDWSIFRPWFSVRNANGDTVLTIKGPLLRCLEANFKVKSADGVHRVGMISKQWSGITREFFTDTDNFGISFPLDLDVKIKAVLLGACLLIDFMYFETSPT
ncbi:PREDICTED: phospholipid scramblase 2-like isoform X1 [Polistes dominula]|uniref:Phospholipid scramblase n=1 Tax=Polistes dominula TaxID=743375 RepID=A0ABM1IXH9_POLDO|nr:PREDICTED: phospholipid scramblase 2-like isoform X1 [Polistes dominula]